MGSWEVQVRKLLLGNLTFMDTARRSIGGRLGGAESRDAEDEARMGALRKDSD